MSDIEKKTAEIADTSIGRVISSDILKDTIKVHLYVKPEEIFISMPVMIMTEWANFYGIITNISQPEHDMTRFLSLSDQEIDDDIPIDRADFREHDSIMHFADIACLRILKHDGTRLPFKTIPSILSKVRVANSEDLLNIYSSTDPVIQSRSFPYGYVPNHPETLIPIRFDVLCSRPFGIFGQTGSGKTVTGKNICMRIMQGLEKLGTRMVIFDVQNEYCHVTDPKRRDPGLYDLAKERLLIYTLDKKKLEDQGVTSGIEFCVLRRNLTLQDVISVLSPTKPTEKMISTLYAINTLWRRETEDGKHPSDEEGRETLRYFYDYLLYYYDNEEFGVEVMSTGESYTALRRRLRDLHPEDGALRKYFVNDDRTHDSINEILEVLKSENPDKRSILIHFGRYGKSSKVYEFIANILGRRLYEEYSDRNDIQTDAEHTYYDSVVVYIEEAHKLLSQNDESGSNVFDLLARETRKYGLTLGIVDQMPGNISDEVTSQLNTRIIHRLTDEKDLRVALAGIDISKWKAIISKLTDGESIVFGGAVDYMPTVIKTFYAESEDAWFEWFGISKVAARIRGEISKSAAESFVEKIKTMRIEKMAKSAEKSKVTHTDIKEKSGEDALSEKDSSPKIEKKVKLPPKKEASKFSDLLPIDNDDDDDTDDDDDE